MTLETWLLRFRNLWLTGRAIGTRSRSLSLGDVKRRTPKLLPSHIRRITQLAEGQLHYATPVLHTYPLLSRIHQFIILIQNYIQTIASVGESSRHLRTPPPWRQGSKPSLLSPSYVLRESSFRQTDLIAHRFSPLDSFSSSFPQRCFTTTCRYSSSQPTLSHPYLTGYVEDVPTQMILWRMLGMR
jgi:hypothetical protein